MIARMEKLFLVAPKKLAPKILYKLQQVGVVQVDSLPKNQWDAYRLESEEEARLMRWEAVAQSADHATALLGLESDGRADAFQGDLENAEGTASSYERQAAILVEKRERLVDELQLIELYKEVLEHLAGAVQDLDNSSRLSIIPVLVERREDLAASKQKLSSELENRFLLTEGSVGNLIVAIIITLKRDAEATGAILAHEGLRELPRPGEYAQMDLSAMAARMEERGRLAPQELAAVEESLSQLRHEAHRALQSIGIHATDEANRLHTFRALTSGRYSFALFGWLPVSQRNMVEEVMSRLGDRILYSFEPAEEHNEPARVPVLLENSEWVKPFEPLISFLNIPRYDGWDPTWITATLFPLWVGMIIGDVGYGLIFIGIAWYLSTFVRDNRDFKVDFFKIRLAPEAVARLVGLIKPIIAWTILWGCLYGEVFGNLFLRLKIFGTRHHPGLVPTLIPRTEIEATEHLLFLICIGFGIIQVLHGFILKAKMNRVHGERKHFWEATGYLGGVSALALFAYAFLTVSYPQWLLALMVAGAVLFVVGMLRARMPLMLVELPTQVGHILSYIRIYAVGLASAILANMATDIGFGLYRTGGTAEVVASALVGLLLGIMVHAILLILLTISHVVQPIRLLWVEFFTKFDFYNLSGRPYRPFKLHGGAP